MSDDRLAWQPQPSLLLAGLFDVLLAALALVVLLSRSRPRLVLLLGGLAPAVALGGFVALVSWTRRHDPAGRQTTWVALATVVGAALFALAGAAQAVVEMAAGVPQPTWRLAVSAWACGGAFIGTAVGLYDAARRQRTAELRAARREADDLAEGLSVLNRVLRHDIRNQVNVAMGTVQRASEHGDLDGAAVERVRTGMERVVELADRARTAEQVIRESDGDTTVDVAAHLRALVREHREADTGVTIETELPETALAACHHRIGEALGHLVENAVEHGSGDRGVDGQPTVTVTVSVADGDGPGRVVVRVIDEGPGIPEQEVTALEDGSEGPLAHSRGTGLWLTKWIVEGSGGELSFERCDGGGTRVEVALPRAVDQTEPADGAAAPTDTGATAGAPAGPRTPGDPGRTDG